MGKQRDKHKRTSSRPESVNSVNWDAVARDLVRAGLASELILDSPILNRTGRETR